MSDSKLTFLGAPSSSPPRAVFARKLRSLPSAFLLVVALPTLLAAAYFGMIASPRYVSEARFVVRSQSQEAPSSLGFALQGVGLSTSQTDAFAVHEYVESRQAVADLQRTMPLRGMLAPVEADPLFRFPRFAEGSTNEDLHAAFARFLTIGYDSTTGISTLRVEAFSARDAERIAEGLLKGGESLVNQLNERSSIQAVLDAQRRLSEAEDRLANVQGTLATFRNREGLIDPTQTATQGGELISRLMLSLAELRAERAQVAAGAPQSPQIATLDTRIAAYEDQISDERKKLVGDTSSLAPKIGAYERLSLDQELAGREVAAARSSLDDARIEARRQQLYLERIVPPNLPDKATQPKRILAILTVFLSTLLAYGVGWLIWAGVREHRQV